MGQVYNEQWVIENQQLIQATYAEAGHELDLNNVVWSARMVYDATARPITYEDARQRHLQELRRQLGLGTPIPEPGVLPRLRIAGKFFQHEDGTPWTMIQCSDFMLLQRFVNGEDINPILEQRSSLGFNTLRVWTGLTSNASIGTIVPNDALYERIGAFLDKCASYGLYVEFTAFTGPYVGMFNSEDAFVTHWDRLVSECLPHTNVFLELVNEADNTPNLGLPYHRLTRPGGIIASRGSMRADQFPTLVWDYAHYHSNDLHEWQRKVGHNAFEIAEIFNVPVTSNENTRMPDRDGNVIHAYDAAHGAALLCAGACFHSVRGKNSQLWDGIELACAREWARGAREVPSVFQQGRYERHDELNVPGVIIRAYRRVLPDGRQFTVLIRA